MSGEVKLMPCAHCGSEGELFERYRGLWNVHCLNDDCGVTIDPAQRSPSACAEAWNRRPTVVTDEVVGWQPIETAPKNKIVDLWAAERERYENERVAGCWWSRTRDAWVHCATIFDGEQPSDEALLYNVTHWMPLPEPPRAAIAAMSSQEGE
jgi:hypothetical protein